MNCWLRVILAKCYRDTKDRNRPYELVGKHVNFDNPAAGRVIEFNGAWTKDRLRELNLYVSTCDDYRRKIVGDREARRAGAQIRMAGGCADMRYAAVLRTVWFGVHAHCAEPR